MTKREMEVSLIQMGKTLQTLVCAYSPNANHVGITIVNGNISVNACQYDGEKEEYIEKDILNATLFADGVMHLDGQYIYPEGVA